MAVARMLAENSEVVSRISDRLRGDKPAMVVTIARGSSDNACTYGRYLIENATGIACASSGLSMGSIYAAPFSGNALCIAVSQSGASPDLLAAVKRARLGGAYTIGLINQPNSPLAAECDEVIELEAGPERSVAATKSFIASIAAFAWMVAEWAGDDVLLKAVHDLPALLTKAWELDWTALEGALVDASNLYVIGRGPGLGIAQEAALKLKETCNLHAEAFSAAEVLHGPMALIHDGFPVLAFAQGDESQPTTIATAEGLADRSANVMIAGSPARGCKNLPSLTAHPALEPILMALSFYRATANLSLARGLDPDCPPHLAKVTRTL